MRIIFVRLGVILFSASLFAAGFVTSRKVSAIRGEQAEARARADAAAHARTSFPINRARVADSIERARTQSVKLRQEIIARIIATNVTVVATREGYLASYYGIRVRGVMTRGGGRCLVVYLHGHNGNPFDYAYHNEILAQSRARRCDVLSLSMVGMGLNAGPASYPSATLGETVNLDATEAANHESYSLFSDPAQPSLPPLSLIISGHYAIVSEAVKHYDDVSMIGISGGGWTTTLLAALIPEVDRSIDWAGSLPDEYRLPAKNIGDLEQRGPFYRDFDYWTLYELGTLDKDGRRTRTAFLIYDDEDPCCFANPSAAAFQRDMAGLGSGRVIIVRSREHAINAAFATRLLFKS